MMKQWHRLIRRFTRYAVPLLVHNVHTVLSFAITRLLRLNDEFDGISNSCRLRFRFRHGYGDFGSYDHSDIMTKMVWS